jgi:hypothetical protein
MRKTRKETEILNKLFNNSLKNYNVLIEKLFDGTITEAEKLQLKFLQKQMGMQDGIFDMKSKWENKE